MKGVASGPGWAGVGEGNFRVMQQTNSASDLRVNGPCADLLSCILNSTSEAIKGNMASATLLLGLMPTILTFLGSSSPETALLAMRRPFLSLLLACGSPAGNPIATFAYSDPVADLKACEGRLIRRRLSTLTPLQAAAISVAECVLAIGAIANIISVSLYAGLRTINTISCAAYWLPVMWVSLSAVVYLVGVLEFALRAQPTRVGGSGSRTTIIARFSAWMRHEFTPCISHEMISLDSREETLPSVLVSWFVSVLTVAYVIFGTVAFSSLVFIGKLHVGGHVVRKG